MYRLALAGLLALAFVDIAAACPPAPHREIVVNGIRVKEHYCDGGKVLFMHENVYRCFERSLQCPNGFWHENKCHCFPGTHQTQPGVCGQICPNCKNGWCYSTSKCICNDGFQMINGQCVTPYNPYAHPASYNHPYQQLPPNWYPLPQQNAPPYLGPQQYPPHLYPGPPPQTGHGNPPAANNDPTLDARWG